MRIENLREFVVFARALNVSKAARKLNLSQSTLSRHLLEMEKELGFALVDRKAGTGLTTAGMHFLSDAERILFIYDSSLESCTALSRTAEQTINVQEYGGHPDVSARLSSLVGQFNAKNQHAVIEWSRFSGIDLAEAVLDGTLDVGQTVIHESAWPRTQQELAEKGIDAFVLHEEGIVYWMDASDPLAQKGEATLDEVSDFVVAMPLGKLYNPMRNAMDDLFKVRKMMPTFKYSKTWSISDMSMGTGVRTACVLPPAAKEDLTLKLRDDMKFVDITDVQSGFLTCLLFRSDEQKEMVTELKDFILDILGK